MAQNHNQEDRSWKRVADMGLVHKETISRVLAYPGR